MKWIGVTRDEFQDDFLGFSFNGHHSSEFGITRVSVSNRYEDKLLPTMKDKTVEVPGGDGKYYFGSQYTDKPWQISVAFDSVSRAQLEGMRNWLGDRGVHELIFDEDDYKAYYAKCTGSPNLKYLCFDQDDGEGTVREVYKGEGTFNFTAFYPFAHSTFELSEVFLSKSRILYSSNSDQFLKIYDLVAAEVGEDLSLADFIDKYTVVDLNRDRLLGLPYSTIYFYFSSSGHNKPLYWVLEDQEAKLGYSLDSLELNTIAFDYGDNREVPLLCGQSLYEKNTALLVFKTEDWIKNRSILSSNFIYEFDDFPIGILPSDFTLTYKNAEAAAYTLELTPEAAVNYLFTEDQINSFGYLKAQVKGLLSGERQLTLYCKELANKAGYYGLFRLNWLSGLYSYEVHTGQLDGEVTEVDFPIDLEATQEQLRAFSNSEIVAKTYKLKFELGNNANEIKIDSRTALLYVDGVVHNDYITEGDFFQLPIDQVDKINYTVQFFKGDEDIINSTDFKYRFMYY